MWQICQKRQFIPLLIEEGDFLPQDVKNNNDEIIKYGGEVDEFNKVLETLKFDKSKKSELAKMAIKQYGSIEKYTEAMKNNLSNFSETMETLNAMKDDIGSYVDKSTELMARLTSDLSKDVSSKEIQQIVDELINMGSEHTQNMDLGDGYWNLMADGYLTNSATIEVTDKKYGKGASAFIGEALKAYQRGKSI